MINTNITIFIRYGTLPMFVLAFSNLLQHTFASINIPVKIITTYEEMQLIKNNIVFLVMAPTKYYDRVLKDKIFDASNKYVLWHMESYESLDGPEHINPKTISKVKKIKNLLLDNKLNISYILFHDYDQYNFFKNFGNNCSYFPAAGYHECLSSGNLGNLEIKKSLYNILFLGNKSKRRNTHIWRISKYHTEKCPIIVCYVGDNPGITSEQRDSIYMFSSGLYCPSRKLVYSLSWLRFVQYAANEVLFFSSSFMKNIELENGKHYIYYSSLDELVFFLKEFSNNREKQKYIVKNMYTFLKENYYFPNILKNFIKTL